MRHSSQHIGLYLLCFALGIFFSQFFDAINENDQERSRLGEQKTLQKKRLTVFEDTVKKLVKAAPENESPIDEGLASASPDRQQEVVPKIAPPPVETFQNIDFSECVRLPRDRDRQITVPSANNELRQEIEKLKIKPFLLKENLFRKIPKLVFFAGLEGTGHHLIDATFKDVCSMVNVTKISKCRAATNIIPNHVGNIGRNWDFKKLSEDATKHNGFLDQIKEQKKYANEIMFLNSMRHHKNIFLDAAVSYPDGGHPRIDNYPDVRFLAEILSKGKLDFNIILMVRDIDSLLVSTVMHRAFEPNFYNQANIFEFMLEMLVGQLSKIDKKFIAGCIKLDSAPHVMRANLRQIDENINATHIKFEPLIMKKWQPKKQAGCIHPEDLDPKLMYRLVVLNQQLQSFCPF